MLQECASYMDACIYNSESKKLMGSELVGPQASLGVLKKEKYEAAVHLHYAMILNTIKNHEEALRHAQIGFKKALICMKICHRACVDHLNRHNKLMSTVSIRKRLLKQSQYNLIESPHYQNFHKTVNSALPFLQYFHNKYHSTSKKPQKIKLQAYSSSYFSEDKWVEGVSIEEITQLKPLNPGHMSNSVGIHAELSTESMVNKLFLVISCMYLISAELKYSKGQIEEAKAWFKKTIQSASEVFPTNSKIIQQLKEKYSREYNILDLFQKRARHKTLSTRVRTPVPPSNLRPWSRNRSCRDRGSEVSSALGKNPQNSLKNSSKHNGEKISSTPQPRPNTGFEKKRNRNDVDEGKISDFILNSYDLY